MTETRPSPEERKVLRRIAQVEAELAALRSTLRVLQQLDGDQQPDGDPSPVVFAKGDRVLVQDPHRTPKRKPWPGTVAANPRGHKVSVLRDGQKWPKPFPPDHLTHENVGESQ